MGFKVYSAWICASWLVVPLTFVAPAAAQGDDPFKGRTRDEMDEEVVARERAVYEGQCKEEGKPEKIWDKIVTGKLRRYFKEHCLIDQIYIKDTDQSVGKLLEAVGKQIDDTIQIVRFARIKAGEE